RGRLLDGREFPGPVQPGPRLQRDMAAVDAHLDTIAVELDLMAPASAAGRTVRRLAELRLDENRHPGGLRAPLARLGLLQLFAAPALGRSPRRFADPLA